MNQQLFDQMQNQNLYYQVSSSNEHNVSAAVQDLAKQLEREIFSFILIFFPEDIDAEKAKTSIKQNFTGTTVFGATSAGQITKHGYEQNAFMAIGFPKNHFHVSSILLDPVQPFDIEKAADQIEQASSRFSHSAGWNRLGLLFCDGLSRQEDVLIATISAILPNVPVFGGSAAEHQKLGKTMIFCDGEFKSNVALMLLIETNLGFDLVNFDHFVATDERLVVTEARPNSRLLLEINGAPAVEEYARIIGVEADKLKPEVYAQHPFLVKVGEDYHARAIQKINEDGTISLLCSIDKGVILRIGKAEEIVRRMRKNLEASVKHGNQPEFILGFDCFLRRLEIEQRGRVEAASEVLKEYRVFGFNTFGEQHSGLHVNQTFVGIAFFRPDETSL